MDDSYCDWLQYNYKQNVAFGKEKSQNIIVSG